MEHLFHKSTLPMSGAVPYIGALAKEARSAAVYSSRVAPESGSSCAGEAAFGSKTIKRPKVNIIDDLSRERPDLLN